MLTCLASESTSLTFLTFPPQLLRMGERGAWLWFHCTWPVRQLWLLLPLLPWPHGTPWGIGVVENTHISHLVHCSATSLEGLTQCGSTGQGQVGDSR